jgi:hypothetical protein
MHRLLLCAVLVVVLLSAWLYSVDAVAPDDVLILLNTETCAEMQEARVLIESLGGEVRHIFPPHVMIGRVRPALVPDLVGQAGIDALAYEFVDPEDYAAYGFVGQQGIRIWNANYQGGSVNAPAGLVDEDEIEVVWLAPPPAGPSPDHGQGFYDTTEYMAGDVVVGVVLPESNGVVDPNVENWTAEEVIYVHAELQAAMEQYALWEPDAGLTFIYSLEDVPPVGGMPGTVACDYEAILHDNFDPAVTNSLMASLGYTDPDPVTNLYSYANDRRDQYAADWVFVSELVDNSVSGGGRSQAMGGGPAWISYVNRQQTVYQHETAHMFWALDAYCLDPPCPSPLGERGYLRIVNANSQGNDGQGYNGGAGEGLPDLMINNHPTRLSAYARGQIGWRDWDGDGLLDVAEPLPDTVLHAPTGTYVKTLTGTATVSCHPNETTGRSDVSMHTIAAVEYCINGTTWLMALPLDGAFDSGEEAFTFSTPPLVDGEYEVEARAVDSAGNVERLWPARAASVYGSPITNSPPFAVLSGPSVTSAGAVVHFDASGSADLQDSSNLLQVRWDWESDGSWDTSYTTVKTATTTYSWTGTVTITLEVRDTDAATSTTSLQLAILGDNVAPVADLSVTPGRVYGQVMPVFGVDASASWDAEDGSDLIYRWDWDGDGAWDTGFGPAATATHTYTFDSNPPVLSRYDTSNYAWAAWEVFPTLYLADGDDGVLAFDVADPANPDLLGGYNTPGHARDLFVSGVLAYVADRSGGLQILDVSDPGSPAYVGSYPMGDAYSVVLSDTLAYVADADYGLRLVDVTAPSTPALCGQLALPGSPVAVALEGDTAYVALYDAGLAVVEVTDPTSPTLATVLGVPDLAHDVSIADGVLYLAAAETGVLSFDATDPLSPTLLAETDTFYARALALQADRLYVADWYGSVPILDVSDPASPVAVGLAYTFQPAGLFVTANRLYSCDTTRGFYVVDLVNWETNLSQVWQIALEVQDSQGASDVVRRNVWANRYDHPPTAALTHTLDASQDLMVHFDASASTDPDRYQVWDGRLEFRWDWESDGHWDTLYSMAASVSHIYETIGTHQITMQVRDRYDAADVITQTVVIANASPVVTPSVLFSTLPEGEQEIQSFLLSNEGDVSLPFQVGVTPGLQGVVPWLDVSPSQGLVPPGSQVMLEAIFDATETLPGIYGAQVIIYGDTQEPVSVTVPAYLQVVEAEVVAVVTPTILSAELPIGGMEEQILTVGNEGNVAMAFTLTVSSPEWPVWLEVSPVTGTVEAGLSESVSLKFDAAGMQPGLYTTDLVLENNGPSTPTVAVQLLVRPYAVYLPTILRGD